MNNTHDSIPTDEHGRPRVFPEEKCPVEELGIECQRERGASGALPPLTGVQEGKESLRGNTQDSRDSVIQINRNIILLKEQIHRLYHTGKHYEI